MDFDLFKKENEIIAQFEERLNAQDEASIPIEDVRLLFAEYKKLSKSSRRLIRLSDRNEKELMAANKEIAAQKKEIEQAQTELVQAEKLASLGQLVAGVAHEINTPVGIMLTSASSLKKETEHLKTLLSEGKIKKSSITEYIAIADDISDLILRHCSTTSDLITSFKAVSVDRNVDETRDFDIVDYTQDILRSIMPSMKSQQVEISLKDHTPIMVHSYPGAINQVVSNIVLNAYKHGLDDGHLAGAINIDFLQADDNRLTIEISDTGKGIPTDFIEQIFDPFVTSARNNGGTGLGLNIVYNLVTSKLKGKITVESNQEDRQTKFKIEIPRFLEQTNDTTA